jgi:LSD1 subclass zinc finger protein
MAGSDKDVLSSIEGKPAHAFGTMLTASSWGYTRLELHPRRLVERTKHFVARTDSELLLAELQGAAVATRGNPALLALGFATLAFLGLGLIFLLLYLFAFKKRFLIFHGGTFTQHLTIKGDEAAYRDFMEDVLSQAEKIKKERTIAGGSSPPVSTSPASGHVATSRAAEGFVMNCPTCGAEYRLPPGSAGKKFRCSSCKAVMQAPPGA